MRRWMSGQTAASQDTSGGGGGNSGGNGEQSHFRQSGQGHLGAERGGSLRQKGGIGMILRRAEEFNLTDKQEAKLNKMRTEFELEKVDLRAALSKAQIMFRSLIRDHDSSEEDVLAAIDKLAAAEADLRKMRYYHMKKTHKVLDNKQMTNLKTFHRNQKREKIKSLRLAQRGESSSTSS
ncbi:MAG TPA: hypothetical protein VGC91_17120 [Pyrinomonadaceae bacterium]